jgi:CBS domain containing-hemolysin-like protein
MELIYFAYIIIIAGLLCGLLSSALNGVSFENITSSEMNDTKRKHFSELKSHSNEIAHSLILYEIAFYIIGVCLSLPLWLFYEGYWIGFFLNLTLSLIVIFMFRAVFDAIGHRWADAITYKSATIILVLSFIVKPFTNFIFLIRNKIKGSSGEDASLEELNAMVETAHDDGSLDAGEYRILKNIMRFSNVLVSDVMTPRTVVFSCQADITVGEIISMTELQMYSRFPIWEGESLEDKIVGYVMSRDVLFSALKGKNSQKLRNISREIHFIPENAELDVALDSFLKKRQQIFLVVDEWGGIEGLLTMEDVMETILGAEIVDEADRVVDLRELAKQHRDKRIAQIKLSHEND